MTDIENPNTMQELLTCVRDLKPCRIHKSHLNLAQMLIDSGCSSAEVDIEAKGDYVTLTPVRVELNDVGRQTISFGKEVP